jgi:hypothetical protein
MRARRAGCLQLLHVDTLACGNARQSCTGLLSGGKHNLILTVSHHFITPRTFLSRGGSMRSRRTWLFVAVPAVLLPVAFFAQAQRNGVQVRTYYIAADEMVWDYAPTGKDGISGQEFGAEQQMFATAGPRGPDGAGGVVVVLDVPQSHE